MIKVTLYITILMVTNVFGQNYIDMTDKLANINGHLTIDGNLLHTELNNRDQIIITGKDMVLNDRSSFIFHNVIVQLDGEIVVKGKIRPVLFDSFIFCKDAGPLESKNIIEVKSLGEVVVGKVDYIKKIPGNPEIWIYNAAGKRLFKGKKSETDNFRLPISRYDVKIIGIKFEDKILFY